MELEPRTIGDSNIILIRIVKSVRTYIIPYLSIHFETKIKLLVIIFCKLNMIVILGYLIRFKEGKREINVVKHHHRSCSPFTYVNL